MDKNSLKFQSGNGQQYLRDPQVSFYDNLMSHPLIAPHKHKFIEVEEKMRMHFFALDHYNQWDNSDLEYCCKPTWDTIENKYSWNIDAFLRAEILAKLPTTIGFETLVAITRLLPMLILPYDCMCSIANCPCRVESFQVSPQTVLVATDDCASGHRADPMPPQPPKIVISGRTFAEYDKPIMGMASKLPTYIRGVGRIGDAVHAGEFKARMINMLGVTHYLEGDDTQIEIIKTKCPFVTICKTTV